MNERFDVAIIGAGSSGCVLAHHLSADPSRKVILIEAGDFARDPDIQDPGKWPQLPGRDYDWAFRTVPQPYTANRVHDWPRGRIIGGSSCLHAMAYVRGHKQDFDAWGLAGGSAWSYQGLLPAFKAIENPTTRDSSAKERAGLLDVYLPDQEVNALTRAFMAAGQALGVPQIYDHNQGELIGATPNRLNIASGQRVSLADAYLSEDVKARNNLRLLTGHVAEHLKIKNGRVTGLLVKTPRGIATIKADRFILSAGAVASPLLLMRSGVGDPARLENVEVDCLVPAPEVGLNLQDHMLVLGNLYGAAQEVSPSLLQHSESLMYLNSADLHAQSGVPDIVVACVVAPSVAPGLDTRALERTSAGFAFTLLSGITHPTSRGQLFISGPASDDRPVIDPRYLESAHDRNLMRAALRTAREIGVQAPLAPWIHKEILPGIDVQSDEALDDFIARAASTHHHPAGTCRMGQDERAVVDKNLKVRGLDNVYVVDASIMPTLPSGPINAATIAIAQNWVSLEI